MTTLDQRILIPAAPDVVWDIVKDINSNPNWQVDCREIAHLSSRRDGPGLRWRSITTQSREYVLEVTAWYDGLGYEYTYVDGGPFREARGRLRLQEIPEGTIVQWTISYEIGGLLSSMRDMNTRRNLEKVLVDSLKALYTLVKQSGARRDVNEAKSLIREALDYEARAQYTPRHPSRYTEQPEDDAVELVSAGIIEPTLTEEDTRPNPVVADTETLPPEVAYAPPTELSTQPEAVPDITPEQAPAPEKPETPQDAASHARFMPPTDAQPEDETLPKAPIMADEAQAPEAAPEQAQANVVPDNEPDPLPKAADASASIWEIFGIERPSTLDETTSPAKAETTPAPEPVAEQATPTDHPLPEEDTSPADHVLPEETAATILELPTDIEESEETVPAIVSEVEYDTQQEAPLRPPQPVILPQAISHGFRFHARRQRVKIRRRA